MKKKSAWIGAAIGLAFGLSALPLSAQSLFPERRPAEAEPMIGEMKLVAFNFCPRGWAEADGQLLPIASNTALFSLLGTMYGGDGRTTFALPDLRGRLPMGAGKGPDLFDAEQGAKQGPHGVETGDYTLNRATLVMRYCIATEGKFPMRGSRRP